MDQEPVKIVIEVETDGSASCIINDVLDVCKAPGVSGFAVKYGVLLGAAVPEVTVETVSAGTIKGKPADILALFCWDPFADAET